MNFNTAKTSLLSILLSLTMIRAGESPAARESNPGKGAAALSGSPWENISDEFFKTLGVYDMKPDYVRRCVGLAVTPTGEIFILTSKQHGICVSRDQGKTWSVVPANHVTGRCETGFGFSIAYPYDGRLAFFSIDGTGGISIDGGVTWRTFTSILRMFEFADVDWSARDPQNIFGLLHEPFYTVLSMDGGRSWNQLYKEAEAPQELQRTISKYQLGIIDGHTLVRSHRDQAGITLSTDAGKTWTDVASYKVLGRRPVHYGAKVFWTTTDGVIVTTDGKDWALTGKGPENANYGPYFGETEREFMLVSGKAFFITRDGGKSWKNVAPAFFPSDGYTKAVNISGSFNYFGWDAKNNLIYASSLGGSVYRLKVKP